MSGFINGTQWLIIMILGASYFMAFFSAGLLSSFVFGGVGAIAIVGFVYGMFPRTGLYLFTAIWGVAGYALMDTVTGLKMEAIAGGLLAGGLGYFSNAQMLHQNGLDQPAAPATPPQGGDTV